MELTNNTNKSNIHKLVMNGCLMGKLFQNQEKTSQKEILHEKEEGAQKTGFISKFV